MYGTWARVELEKSGVKNYVVKNMTELMNEVLVFQSWVGNKSTYMKFTFSC